MYRIIIYNIYSRGGKDLYPPWAVKICTPPKIFLTTPSEKFVAGMEFLISCYAEPLDVPANTTA
jgi:hypothetical protein